jgi:hypothetical protein
MTLLGSCSLSKQRYQSESCCEYETETTHSGRFSYRIATADNENLRSYGFEVCHRRMIDRTSIAHNDPAFYSVCVLALQNRRQFNQVWLGCSRVHCSSSARFISTRPLLVRVVYTEVRANITWSLIVVDRRWVTKFADRVMSMVAHPDNCIS